jgi:aminoglycoside phosphotransferase (APT) family kinase protein
MYDAQTRQAIKILGDTIDGTAATALWDKALTSVWKNNAVCIHGDVSAQNLLAKNGKLSAVIDFEGFGTGDPACDLVIAWTLFAGESRDAFRKTIALDDATWDRGRGWVALIVYADLCSSNNPELERKKSHLVLAQLLENK